MHEVLRRHGLMDSCTTKHVLGKLAVSDLRNRVISACVTYGKSTRNARDNEGPYFYKASKPEPVQ